MHVLIGGWAWGHKENLALSNTGVRQDKVKWSKQGKDGLSLLKGNSSPLKISGKAQR